MYREKSVCGCVRACVRACVCVCVCVWIRGNLRTSTWMHTNNPSTYFQCEDLHSSPQNDSVYLHSFWGPKSFPVNCNVSSVWRLLRVLTHILRIHLFVTWPWDCAYTDWWSHGLYTTIYRQIELVCPWLAGSLLSMKMTFDKRPHDTDAWNRRQKVTFSLH